MASESFPLLNWPKDSLRLPDDRARLTCLSTCHYIFLLARATRQQKAYLQLITKTFRSLCSTKIMNRMPFFYTVSKRSNDKALGNQKLSIKRRAGCTHAKVWATLSKTFNWYAGIRSTKFIVGKASSKELLNLLRVCIIKRCKLSEMMAVKMSFGVLHLDKVSIKLK